MRQLGSLWGCSLLLSIFPIQFSNAQTAFKLPINEQQHLDVIAHFSETFAAEIDIQPSDYWQLYLNAVRQGESAIFWVAPHFASWLVNQHSFKPIIRLRAPLQYVLISRRNSYKIFEVGDLDNKQVCTQHAMNLDSLYASKIARDNNLSIKRGVSWDIETKIEQNDQRCDAFVVTTVMWQRIQQSTPTDWIVLAQSELLPNYALVAHPSIDPVIAESVANALSDSTAEALLAPLTDDRPFNEAFEIINKSHVVATEMEWLKPYWQNPK